VTELLVTVGKHAGNNELTSVVDANSFLQYSLRVFCMLNSCYNYG